MGIINTYLQLLTETSEKKLRENFNIDKLRLGQFELVNSYLIYQTIKDNNQNINTLIYLPEKKSKSKFYIPVIFTLAIYNLMDNYLDDETDYQINDIVQKNGVRYSIIEKNENEVVLYNNRIGRKTLLNKKLIKQYILTNADLRNRKVKLKFDSYVEFFRDLLNLDMNEFPPSKFKYKSIIVTDKQIVEELKDYEIDNNKIHKAFPFQYITKNGKRFDNLPIDPMIYVVNDYETARNFILFGDTKIRSIIFIGANKYKDNCLQLSEDLNTNILEHCLMIGSSDIGDNCIPSLYKWNWTLRELKYFNYFETFDINTILVESNEFTSKLNEFDQAVRTVEIDYGLNFKELYKFTRNLFSVVVTTQESRLAKQFDNLIYNFKNEGYDIVDTAFYEIDEYDYESIWDTFLETFSELVAVRKENNIKYQNIKNRCDIDYLVVQKDYIEIWKEELVKNNRINVISFSEYKNLEVNGKVIVFLGFFGYEHLKSILFKTNKIEILMFTQELEYYNYTYDRIIKETMNEINCSDRKILSGIKFKDIPKEENISELIKRVFESSKEDKISPYYCTNYSNGLFYKITFENEEDILELEGNKSVLLEVNENEREEYVKNLKFGDKIRVYDNSSKDELYKIALNEDDEHIFSKIEEYSRLWKYELLQYSKEFDSLKTLFQHLVVNGLSICNVQTIKNWINLDSKIKFPQRTKDILVLKKLINSNIFNTSYKEIVKCSKVYNGIMIASGRKLSDAITEYIKLNKKNNILKNFTDKQIQQFVDCNAKKRTIKNIEVINYDEK